MTSLPGAPTSRSLADVPTIVLAIPPQLSAAASATPLARNASDEMKTATLSRTLPPRHT
jgi:hypothetical protein